MKKRVKKTQAEEKGKHPFWESVEHYNAKLIPFAIVVLLFVIIVELFFHEFAEHHHLLISILDYLVIAVFVVDLIFLAIHARSIKFFFKNYWLDLLAVFPFALIFTFINRIYYTFVAVRELSTSQAILHETLEAKKAAAVLAKSSALTESTKVVKSVRLITRVIRVVSKSRLFTHVHYKHHLAKRKVYPKIKTKSRN